MHLHKNKCNVLIVLVLYCKTLLLRWDASKVRDRFGGKCRFKDELKYKEWVNRVIINVYKISALYKCFNRNGR